MGDDLGRAVRVRRGELGLSRRELAERSETSYPYLSQIETGDREPSLRTLQRLASALELPVEALASSIKPSEWSTGAPEPLMAAAAAPETGEKERAKVLASVERRLQALEPVDRMEVLAELMQRASREVSSRSGR